MKADTCQAVILGSVCVILVPLCSRRCSVCGGQQGLIQCFQSPVSPVPCLLLSSLNFNVNPLLLMMIIHSTPAPETEADLYSIRCYSCCICVGPLQQTDFVAGHTPLFSYFCIFLELF